MYCVCIFCTSVVCLHGWSSLRPVPSMCIAMGLYIVFVLHPCRGCVLHRCCVWFCFAPILCVCTLHGCSATARVLYVLCAVLIMSFDIVS